MAIPPLIKAAAAASRKRVAAEGPEQMSEPTTKRNCHGRDSIESAHSRRFVPSTPIKRQRIDVMASSRSSAGSVPTHPDSLSGTATTAPATATATSEPATDWANPHATAGGNTIVPDGNARSLNLLSDVVNPFGDDRVLGSKNLRLALQALHRSLPTDSCEMQRQVWDYLGQEGLLRVFLAGLKLASAWRSVSAVGHVSADALAQSDPVTAQVDLMGIYMDCGCTAHPVRYAYVGSGQGWAFGAVKGKSRKLRGIARRVLYEHESPTYRKSHPSRHYEKGYKVRAKQAAFYSPQRKGRHSYIILWGLDFDLVDLILCPLYNNFEPALCRSALIAFIEALSITLLAMFKGKPVRQHVKALGVCIATLDDKFEATNRASGLEGLSAAEWAALNPEAARAARKKGHTKMVEMRREQMYDEFIAGTRSYKVKVPGKGQYRVSESDSLLSLIEERLGWEAGDLRDIALPLPSDEINRRPWMIKNQMLVKAIPAAVASDETRFAPDKLKIAISSSDGTLLFTYGIENLHPRSQPKWVALCEWFSIMSEGGVKEEGDKARNEAATDIDDKGQQVGCSDDCPLVID